MDKRSGLSLYSRVLNESVKMPVADAVALADPARLRRTMADCQLRTFEVTDPDVLAAFESVPREQFVGAANALIAYSDASLRVRAGASERALLSPMVLARMLQGATLRKSVRALAIGDGFGYSAAILAAIVASVVSLDVEPAFEAAARDAFAALGLGNATAATGLLEKGWPGAAPYDFILINGAVEANYRALFDQLAPGGRLVSVVRGSNETGRSTKATLFSKLEGGAVGEKWLFDAAAETLGPFRRVPAFVF